MEACWNWWRFLFAGSYSEMTKKGGLRRRLDIIEVDCV